MDGSEKNSSDLEVRSKIWIEISGEPVFSRGRWMLLKEIETHGSINQAAIEIGIPYRRAWGYIQAMEERLGFPLVNSQVGGQTGGGTSLTEGAREFLVKYEKLENGMNEMVDRRFSEIFGTTPEG